MKWSVMKRLSVAALVCGLWIAGPVPNAILQAQSTTIPAAWSGQVSDAALLPVEKNAWGTLQWLCS